jgi:hypothetical protein
MLNQESERMRLLIRMGTGRNVESGGPENWTMGRRIGTLNQGRECNAKLGPRQNGRWESGWHVDLSNWEIRRTAG